MTDDAIRAQVTLSLQTIHNPAEPRHFMRLKPVPGRVRILLDGTVLADTRAAMRVIEAGKDLYDPVFYIPRADVQGPLSRTDKETYCPLKGHASYFDLVDASGAVRAPEIAWSYERVHDFADGIRDLVAFYATKVVIEEHPQ